MAQDRLTGAARGGISRTGTGQVSVILAGAVLIGGALAEAAAPGPVMQDLATWITRTEACGPRYCQRPAEVTGCPAQPHLG